MASETREDGPEVAEALALPEQQLDFKQPVRLGLAIRNPTAQSLWIRISAEGPFVTVHPGIVTISPASVERVTVTIQTAQITKENHAAGRLRLAWRALAPPGGVAGDEGERVVRLDVPRPRKPVPCPGPGCTAIVREGDRVCARCGLLLRFCPACGTPNSRAASSCRANGAHALWQSQPWPQIGGSAARDGGARRTLPPRAALVWRFRPEGLPECSLSAPVSAYDVVYVAAALPSGDGRVYALDLFTGAPLWEVRLPEGEAPHPERGAPAIRGQGLFLATMGGLVLALEALSGRQRWVSRIPERIFPAVVAAGERVCAATTRADLAEGHLVCLATADGAKISSCSLQGRTDTPPALALPTAYVACDDGTLRAVDVESGTLRWQVPSGAEFEAGPSVVEGVVYVGTTAGELLAVDARDGSPRWRLGLAPSAVETLPAMGDGRIYCATADGVLHTVSAAGKAVGTVSVGAQVRSAPVAARGGLLFGAEDGRLYHTDGIQTLDPIYDIGRGRRISVPLCFASPYLVFAATGGELFALKVEGEG